VTSIVENEVFGYDEAIQWLSSKITERLQGNEKPLDCKGLSG